MCGKTRSNVCMATSDGKVGGVGEVNLDPFDPFDPFGDGGDGRLVVGGVV